MSRGIPLALLALLLSSCCFVNRVVMECDVMPGGLRSCKCVSLDTGYEAECR